MEDILNNFFKSLLFTFSSRRKRRGSETVSEEGSSGGEDNHGRYKKLSGGGGRLSATGKVSRSVGSQAARKGKDGSLTACPSPIMSECTAAMVS